MSRVPSHVSFAHLSTSSCRCVDPPRSSIVTHRKRKFTEFIATLQFGTQVYSYPSSHEDSGSESSGGQGMGKIGENFGVELDQSQK